VVGDYIVCFDPIDGSSNIDAAVTTGSIFAVYDPGECELDFGDDAETMVSKCITNVQQAGDEIRVAGYCMYSSSTVFVLTVRARPACRVVYGGLSRLSDTCEITFREASVLGKPPVSPQTSRFCEVLGEVITSHLHLRMGAGMIGRSQVGDGVFGFTLDTVIGEFVMSHERIQIPDPGQRIYSGNQGNIDLWAPELKKYVEEVLQAGPNPYTYRYIGTYAVALSLELLAT